MSDTNKADRLQELAKGIPNAEMRPLYGNAASVVVSDDAGKPVALISADDVTKRAEPVEVIVNVPAELVYDVLRAAGVEVG